VVFVVDKDASVRESLRRLIQSAGWSIETFSSAREFLFRAKVAVPSCLIVDDSLPDLSALDFQARINADRFGTPVIFITDLPNVRMTVQAIKAGALEFFTKPFNSEAILNTVKQAIDRSRLAMTRATQLLALNQRYAILSAREREVMNLVVEGFLNKQIGWQLGISEITVKAHRGNMMRKMKAATLADLIRKAWMLRCAPGCDEAFDLFAVVRAVPPVGRASIA
jgi:FixJ family two-component response regulator